MLNNTEIKIIGWMLRTPLNSFTIYKLAKQLKVKYSYAHRCVTSLQKRRIIKINKVGNTNQCKINFATAGTDNLAIASIWDKKTFLKENVNVRLIEDLLKEKLGNFLYIALVFGSHASKRTKKGSDIDLFFIIDDEKKIELFQKNVESVLSSLSYKIHIIVSTIEWFYKMMGENGTVGREVLKSSIVLCNPEAYYGLVKKYDQERGY